mgnify:CR=1 FL=1
MPQFYLIRKGKAEMFEKRFHKFLLKLEVLMIYKKENIVILKTEILVELFLI